MFVVTWLEGAIAGYRDFLPNEWFADGNSIDAKEHSILSSRQKIIQARCSISCNSSVAFLDYGGMNEEFNRDNGVDVGVSEINFEGSDYLWMTSYRWGPKEKEIADVNVLLEQDILESVVEGEAVLRRHRHRERNPELVKLKLASASQPIRCEACEFDFADRYGALGKNFCEVHHRVPLSQGPRSVRPSDLALLCANCHRMIHRALVKDPTISVEKFSALYLRGSRAAIQLQS